jgi:hypothetical protein
MPTETAAPGLTRNRNLPDCPMAGFNPFEVSIAIASNMDDSWLESSFSFHTTPEMQTTKQVHRQTQEQG